jgi:hypothetical protein
MIFLINYTLSVDESLQNGAITGNFMFEMEFVGSPMTMLEYESNEM